MPDLTPVRDLIARFPEGSPLGPVESWPETLRVTLRTIVEAPVQIVLFWGADYVALYNDTYAPTIGDRHPRAFGRPAQENWAELWGDLKPLLDSVRERGEVVFAKDRPFYMERFGHPEEVTFDIAYSPVRDPAGAVAGVMCIVSETTERRVYEQRLEESEERFRNMADHAPVMMWVVDSTGHCNYLNPRWYAFTGQKEAEALGTGWLDAIHPEDRPKSEQAFFDALQDRLPMRLEYRLRRHDGTYRWAIDAAEPRFTPDGTFAGYIGSVMDIDDRHEIEDRLRASEQHLNAIAHSVAQMIWTTRPDGHHDFFNDRWYEFTGVPYGSTDGTAWNGVFHPDDRAHARAVWAEALRTGKTYEIEYRLRHHSGEYRWTIGRAQPARDKSGAIVKWYGTCTDIHDLKTQEIQRTAVIALQEEVAGLDDPQDIAHAAARILGAALGVDRVGYGAVDPATETIMIQRNWTSDRLAPVEGLRHFRDYGDFIDLLKAGQALPCTDSATDPAMAGGMREIGAVGILNIPVMEQGSLAAVLFLHTAEPRAWTPSEIAFAMDAAERIRQAAERRRAESELRVLTSSLEEQVLRRTEELRRSEEQLRQSQKMEAVGQLTGGIAHDFNNNLAVVIGGLNLIQRRLRKGNLADTDMLISGAMEGAQRAATLTQRLLAFSRQQPLAPEAVDGNRMIAEMNDLLTRTLGEHIAIETVLGAGLWRTKADPGQLENAILNLAVNARDAMSEGGRLTIETANAHVDDHYGAEHQIAAGQYVLIAVSDTGTGMTPEVIARAFDPFFTTKEVGKGTGLGLSQVFGFVRQTGGHVKIYSEPGIGSSLKIYLPRHYGEEEARTPRRSDGQVPVGHGEQILVVEDDDRVRAFTAQALTDLGYAVTAVSRGAEALSLLRTGQAVDLLFTDIVMPGMTGRALADAAQAMRPGLPVIYATGYTSNAVVHNGILDPGTNFLQKPYMLDQLAQKVRAVLDQRVSTLTTTDSPGAK